MTEGREDEDVIEEEEGAPLTARDFEAAAAADQEAADRRRKENEQLKKQWIERHRTESMGRRILSRLLSGVVLALVCVLMAWGLVRLLGRG